jgi:hypothetical protein
MSIRWSPSGARRAETECQCPLWGFSFNFCVTHAIWNVTSTILLVFQFSILGFFSHTKWWVSLLHLTCLQCTLSLFTPITLASPLPIPSPLPK